MIYRLLLFTSLIFVAFCRSFSYLNPYSDTSEVKAVHLSIIRQHCKRGFQSVVQLIESLEMQIENLHLAQFLDRHLICLERTVDAQRDEIRRLDQVLENKSQQILDLQRINHQSRKASQFHQNEKDNINSRWQHILDKLENRLTETRQINQ